MKSISTALYISVALLIGRAVVAAENQRADVTVVVSLTDAGKKIARPTSERPAYYVPISGGWKEEGELTAGEKPPPTREFFGQMIKAMAKEGYVMFSPTIKQKPTLALVFYWGHRAPQRDGVADDTALDSEPWRHISNWQEMISLVAGDTGIDDSELLRVLKFVDQNVARSDSPMLPPPTQQAMEAAQEARYFIIVDAFDLEASQRNERILLWRARMSTRSQGVSFEQVAQALVDSGVPMFGRRTQLPQILTKPIPEGHVIVGTPKVIDAAPDTHRKPVAEPQEKRSPAGRTQ